MIKKTAVLVVDDEPSIQNFIRKNLEVRGYVVFTAANGLEALASLENEHVDLIILDVMMPHMDGLETTRRIRQKSTVPIILLTALDEEPDKIQAFNIGADDYLTKPFGLGELLGRIKAVMRRAQWGKSPTSNRRIIQGDIMMDLERHEVEVRGKKVSLTPTEYNVLALMISHAGKVLPHSMILKEVWGDEYGGELEYLRVYIGHLRKKIERDPNAPEYLISERGIGYLFNIPKKKTPGY